VVVTAPTHRKERDVWGTRFWGGASSESERDNEWATRPTEITDEQLNQSVQQIDGLGRLHYVCSGIGATTQANGQGPTPCTGVDISASGFLATYGYDPLGNLLSVAYSSEARTYTYDGVSRLTQSVDPESGTVKYAYDVVRAGDFYRKTLNSLKTITYSWDLLHRLTGKTYSDSTPGVSYYYDQPEVENVLPIAYPYGRMTSALSQTSSGAVVGSAFSYDPMGRVLAEWSCTPLTCPSSSTLSPISLQFTFDLAGDLTSLTNASDTFTWGAGVTWNYFYDNTPNLTEVTTNAVAGHSPGTLFNTTTYGPAGNLLTATTGDSVNRVYGYDHAFRLNSVNLSGGLIGTGQNWSVGYYGNNSVHTVADPVNGSWSYGYDKFNRISTASCSGTGTCPYATSSQTLEFTYDQYGNRWTQTASPMGYNPSFQFNTQNQIKPSYGVIYDSDGNLTNDGNGNTFSFDPEGKLTASVVGTVSSTYVNDPFGHRAESVSSAGTFDYVYDPSGRLITEADTACNSGAPYYPCTDFVYIGASRIPFSQFSDPPLGVAAATFNYYDYMGSLRETTSYLGLSSPYQNDPFGDSNSTPPSWFGFGEMLTLGSGVQLSSTRGYHQIEARWLTPDPSGLASVNTSNPQSWNRYAYVLNNPVSLTDPLGLWCVWEDGTHDDDEADGGDSSDQCANDGGHWDQFDNITGIFQQDGIVTQINSVWGTQILNPDPDQGFSLSDFDTSLASYQDTSITVAVFSNTKFNPFNHVALSIGNGPFYGQAPKSTLAFLAHFAFSNSKNGVPGVIDVQNPHAMVSAITFPVSAAEAGIIQSDINQSIQNPPPYDVYGPSPTCDCAFWIQNVLSDAGINTGPPTQYPSTLLGQIQDAIP
jgi:RHS repeat-associated protein